MKYLSRFSIAVTFTLALTLPAYAGDIQTGIEPPPPPAHAAMTGQIETTIAGQTETSSGEVSATDSATEIALNLLQSVLSLF